MARVRLRRILLWALVVLPVVVLTVVVLLGRAWVDRQLRQEIVVGKHRLTFASPRLGWNLEFRADSLRLSSPGLAVTAVGVRAELRVWQSLVLLSPSMLATFDSVALDLPEKEPKAGTRRPLRLRSREPAVFPNVRFPLPFRAEAGRVEVRRAGRPLAGLEGVAAYSQGPKGAAAEWASARLHMASLRSRGDSAAGPRAAAPGAVPAPAADSVLAVGPLKASARWFGKWVRYQARFVPAPGDHFRIDGERRKADLALGRDSVDASIAGLGPYAALFRDGPPAFSAFRLSGSFGLSPTPQADLRAEARVPGPLRTGPHRLSLRLGLADTSGRVVIAARGDGGSDAHLGGSFRLPPLDSLDGAALAAGFAGTFSGYTREVRIPLGRKVLPGDLEIKRLRIEGGEARADVRTRDRTELALRAFRDTAAVAGKRPWRLTFTGRASPTERWIHAWTRDTNIVFREADVAGEFRPGELVAEVWGRDVMAYGARADSLWARNIVRRRGYYLDDSRLHWRGATWPVQGRVEWTARKPVRGPRGIRLRREVSLAFSASHPRHGALGFAMPRRRYMEVTAKGLELERLPYPRLEKVLPYHPELTGRFAWDWEARTGEAGIKAAFLYGGERLGVDLEAGWDPRLLRVPVLEVALREARLRLGADLRLGGRQFHQAGRLSLADVQGLSVETERFDAARLSQVLGGLGPLEGGTLQGRLAYADTAGFRGYYEVEGLRLKPFAGLMEIPRITLSGQGRDLIVSARTTSQKQPWLNDTVSLLVTGVLGDDPGLELRAASEMGAILTFQGRLPGKKSLEGGFRVEGDVDLPGGAGTLREVRLGGRVSVPLGDGMLRGLRVDSTEVTGRYVVAGLDTQSFRGVAEMRDGRVIVPRLSTVDQNGRRLEGEAEYRLGKPLTLTARLRGEALALQVAGLKKLVFREVDASLRADSGGLSATARAARTSFESEKGAVKAKGDLENLFVTLSQRRASGGRESVPKVGLKARLRNFDFKHEIGFRDAQRFFRTVKVEKRKKRRRPVDLDVSIDAVGGENRVQTDILRMFFTGDIALKGVYPYTLLSGEVSALSGEIGQTSQSYDIQDFGLKWQNATVEEGRILVEGAKKLKVDCRPETERTCNVFIKLEGRLDEMAFTYDSDCGQTAGGEVIEPAALINSVSRGCYSGEYVSGAGGGGYGEAVFTFLEPAISETLTKRVSQVSRGWIKTTQVSGIGTMVSRDTATFAEPISLGMETKEKWGVKGMARAGYHPEKKDSSPWENKVAVEWRPPVEKVAKGSEWKRRVRDRITLEASAETRPEVTLGEEETEREVRTQVGVRYRYKFWKLW